MGSTNNDDVQEAINNAEAWMKECQKLDGLIQTIEVQLQTYKQNRQEALIQKERAEAAVINALRRRNGQPPSLEIEDHSFDTEMSDARFAYKRMGEGESHAFDDQSDGSNKRARIHAGTSDAHLSTGGDHLSDASMSGRTPYSPRSPSSPVEAAFSQHSTSTATTASQPATPAGRGRGRPPKTPGQRIFDEAKKERLDSLENKRRARAEDYDEEWLPSHKPASSRGFSKTPARPAEIASKKNTNGYHAPGKKPWEKDFQPILGKRPRDSDMQPNEGPKKTRSIDTLPSDEHDYNAGAPPLPPTSTEWLASQNPPPEEGAFSGSKGPQLFSRRFISKHLGGNEMRDISNVSASRQATQIHPVPGYFALNPTWNPDLPTTPCTHGLILLEATRPLIPFSTTPWPLFVFRSASHWEYMGDYTGHYLSILTPDEFCALPANVKNTWADGLANSSWGQKLIERQLGAEARSKDKSVTMGYLETGRISVRAVGLRSEGFDLELYLKLEEERLKEKTAEKDVEAEKKEADAERKKAEKEKNEVDIPSVTPARKRGRPAKTVGFVTPPTSPIRARRGKRATLASPYPATPASSTSPPVQAPASPVASDPISPIEMTAEPLDMASSFFATPSARVRALSDAGMVETPAASTAAVPPTPVTQGRAAVPPAAPTTPPTPTHKPTIKKDPCVKAEVKQEPDASTVKVKKEIKVEVKQEMEVIEIE